MEFLCSSPQSELSSAMKKQRILNLSDQTKNELDKQIRALHQILNANSINASEVNQCFNQYTHILIKAGATLQENYWKEKGKLEGQITRGELSAVNNNMKKQMQDLYLNLFDKELDAS